jgi:phage gp45-like
LPDCIDEWLLTSLKKIHAYDSKKIQGYNIECNTETFTINAKKIIMNAEEKVELNTPLTDSSGDINNSGNITNKGDIKNNGNIECLADIKGVSVADVTGDMQTMRGVYNPHTHTSTSSRSPTSPPSSSM